MVDTDTPSDSALDESADLSMESTLDESGNLSMESADSSINTNINSDSEEYRQKYLLLKVGWSKFEHWLIDVLWLECTGLPQLICRYK